MTYQELCNQYDVECDSGATIEDSAEVEFVEGWFADDGNADVHFLEAESGFEAAQEYVIGGDWGDCEKSFAISVVAYREALVVDEDGEEADLRFGAEDHLVLVHPEEPECPSGDVHKWQRPYNLVGGISENPGVWGGRGCATDELDVCVLCGMGRRSGGPSQGVESEHDHSYVKYEEGLFSPEELKEALEA